MKLFYYLILLIFYSANAAVAQNAETPQPNLVPNGGFEEFDGFPIGWYYKGVDFDNVVKYWSSPTTASPDAYGTRVRVPAAQLARRLGPSLATPPGIAPAAASAGPGDRSGCRDTNRFRSTPQPARAPAV